MSRPDAICNAMPVRETNHGRPSLRRTEMTDPARLAARPPRDTRIDIIRGWLQLTIFASHAAGSWIGAWLIHGAWGLSDSSEQFVFLSGLMLGSVFTRKSRRDGF